MAQENREDAPQPEPPRREEGAATGQQQATTPITLNVTITVNNEPAARRTGVRGQIPRRIYG